MKRRVWIEKKSKTPRALWKRSCELSGRRDSKATIPLGKQSHETVRALEKESLESLRSLEEENLETLKK